MRPKITVVGAGNVGATVAQRLAERDYADLVLLDVAGDVARAKALDLNQAGAVAGYRPRLTGTDDYEEAGGSDVVVITSDAAGDPEGKEAVDANRGVVTEVCRQVAERSPDAVVVVITQPVAAMCHVALAATEFPRQRVLGMEGVLDSARLRTLLGWELGASPRDVTALVLGGHGHSMVPVLSATSIAGITVRQRIPAPRLEEILQRMRGGGGCPTPPDCGGSASYAPAAAVAEIVDAIVLDQQRVLPCTALCQGEYGLRDVFIGVPVRVGADGVQEIVEMELEQDERAALERAAEALRELA